MKFIIGDDEFDFDPNKMTNVEGMAIEKVTGMTFGEWTESLKTGSMTAQTALVWVIQKRQNPTLRFGEVEFEMGAVQVIQDEDPDPKDEASEATV